MNIDNKDIKKINKVFLDSYSYISFVNIDILPKMEWILVQSSDPVVGYGIDG
jgi:hypothetical protein